MDAAVADACVANDLLGLGDASSAVVAVDGGMLVAKSGLEERSRPPPWVVVGQSHEANLLQVHSHCQHGCRRNRHPCTTLWLAALGG
jgi:hypothetical protein